MKKSFENALAKAKQTPIWKEYTEPGIARNPFSGVEVELNPLELSIYNWCMRWYRNYEYGTLITPTQTYDNMRYLFCELNSNAYYDLLD
jgi:hypothetical protein